MATWLAGLLLLAATQAGASARELLDRATALYLDLEYDQVVPITDEVLARSDLSAEQRINAYVLQASSLAIMGNDVGAEKPFRFLLRARPDFELPKSTPPRILALFRKVQVEERLLAEQLLEVERQKTLKELALNGDPREVARGGEPIVFDYRLRDPRGVVAEVRVNYRKSGEGVFSALALLRNESGAWRGELPAAWTENAGGLRVEYFVSTLDTQQQPLIGLGSASDPMQIEVAPGFMEKPRPLLEQPWFWTLVGSLVVGASVGGYFIYRNSTAPPDSELGVVEYR